VSLFLYTDLMASLGYSSSPATDLPASTALHITRPRKQDRRQRKVTRSVFLCYVLGATGSGKTSLLRSFVNKVSRGGEDGLGGYEPTTKVLSVVNSVEMEGVEKYLVVSNSSYRRQGSQLIFSCKNSAPNTRVKRYATARSWTWRTLSSTCMTRVIRTRFLISQT
jgi:GTPase SAR1 family protein